MSDDFGMERFWDDLLAKADDWQQPKPVASPSWPACCPVCRGLDRLTTLNLETGGTINDACFACDGTGKVMMQAERRAA